MTIEELFGTLQQSFVETWRKHLKTPKYSAHKALNEFYDEMPDLVDQLIEDYMGINGKVEDYKNLLDAEQKDEVAYLEELRKICKEGRELLEDSELESDMDSILSLIDGTLYKLKELKESVGVRSLQQYLTEALEVNESSKGDEKVLWAFIKALKLTGRERSEKDFLSAMEEEGAPFKNNAENIRDTFYDLAVKLQDLSDGKWGSDDNTEYTSWAVVMSGEKAYKSVLKDIKSGVAYRHGEEFAYALNTWVDGEEDDED